MRKVFLCLFLTGLCYVLHAGPVSPEKALSIAAKVFAAQPNTKAVPGELRIIWDGEFDTTKSALDPAFYVVAREGGGFVMVAGNENVRPVLALSYDQTFGVEGMPDNIRYWMERIKAYSRSFPVASAEVTAQWDAFADIKSDIITTSLTDEYKGSRTVEWNQSDPANLKCPTVTGESSRSVCGCVALAISEIMTWYGYPNQGSGTVPEYSFSTSSNQNYTIPAHQLGTVYDWAGLQSLKTASQFYAETNTSLGQNLGQLVFDVGTILQLKYSSQGTGGNVSRISILSEMMGYSKNAILRYRDDGYPDWQWNEMLKQQVDHHPIYYRGSDISQSAGHAYVVDGYATYQNTDLVFHFNFGWGGYCNGYYYSDYQNTSSGYKWEETAALLDFVPDPTGATSPIYELSYLSYGGITATLSNNTLTIAGNSITNSGSDDFNGTLDLFLIDRNGNREDSPVYSMSFDLPLGYYTSRSVYGSASYFLSSCEFGDKYSYFYRSEGEDYKQVTFANPSIGMSEVALTPAACIQTEASYAKGDYFYFRLTNHDYTYKDATWTVTEPGGSTTNYNQSDDRVRLSKSGKYKITVTTSRETIVAVINVN